MPANKDSQTIFRTVKNKDNPFVMIDRRAFEDPQLSWKAKGLLGYLLSRPDNWEVQMGDLIKRSTDGEHATRAAVDELMASGYIVRITERDEQKKFVRFVLTIHERPVSEDLRTYPKSKKPLPENQEMASVEPFCGFPQMGNPQVGNPQVENLPLNNNELTNTDSTNINFSADAQTDTPEEQKPVPPIWGIGWQMAAGQVIVLPSEDESAQAELTNALNLFHEHEQPFVREFVNATGIFPVKADVAFWRKSIAYLQAKGIDPAGLVAAAQQAFKDGMPISSPKSLEKYAVDLRARTVRQPRRSESSGQTPFGKYLDNFQPRA